MAKKATKTPGSTKLKNPKWELFCNLYAGYHNKELFGNGTQCYLLAYGYTERILKLQEKIEKLYSTKPKNYTVEIGKHEAAIKRMKKIGSVEGCRLLVKPSVTARANYLIEKVGDDVSVDRELQYVIHQRKDLSSKVQGIKEYNRVRDRVKDKLSGELILRWEDDEEGED